MLLDIVRILVTLVGTGVAIMLLARWPRTDGWRNRIELLGVTGGVVVLTGSRISNLGQPITWQLPVATVALFAIAYSLVAEYRAERS